MVSGLSHLVAQGRCNLLAMVAHYNNFVGNRAVDDSNDIPVRSNNIILLVIQLENDILRRWANVVVHALVAETEVSCPVLVEVLSLRSDAIESLQDRQSILIRDGNGRNAGDIWLRGSSGSTRLGRVTGCGAVDRSADDTGLTGLELTYGSPGAKLRNCVLPRCTLLG